MHERAIVIARPQHAGQLVLLFHGVGSTAADLVPVGTAIANAHPDAMVVSVDAPHPSTLGRGREWFSVVGITEENRPARIASALPLFLDTLAHWQQEAGVPATKTALVGFSQGAIMALESTQAQREALPAARIVALAGRLATPARRAPPGLHVHLVHGDADEVVPSRYSRDAARELRDLGVDVSLDLLPGLGHGIDQRVLQLVIQRLALPGTAPAVTD